MGVQRLCVTVSCRRLCPGRERAFVDLRRNVLVSRSETPSAWHSNPAILRRPISCTARGNNDDAGPRTHPIHARRSPRSPSLPSLFVGVFAACVRNRNPFPRVSVFPVHPETRGRAFSFHSLSPFRACLRLPISNAAGERVVCRFRAIRKRGISDAKGGTCTIAVPVCGLVVSRGFRSAVACREQLVLRDGLALLFVTLFVTAVYVLCFFVPIFSVGHGDVCRERRRLGARHNAGASIMIDRG